MIEQVYAVTAGLLGIALLVSTAEHLYNRQEMAPEGLLSWTVLKVGWESSQSAALRHGVAWVMGQRPFTAMLVVQGFATVLMVALAARGVVSAVVQGVILGSQLLVHYRNRYALEGADQMMLIIAAALFCYALAPASVLVASAALWFIALQATLSYLVAGVGKLATPSWRSGEALQVMINSEAYGIASGATVLLHRPHVAKVLSWQVMVVESLFPFTLLLGSPLGAVFLVWGAAFHAGNVLVMGLHRFFWAFLASYPAVWFCMSQRWSE
jgi:hypothetical protein